MAMQIGHFCGDFLKPYVWSPSRVLEDQPASTRACPTLHRGPIVALGLQLGLGEMFKRL